MKETKKLPRSSVSLRFSNPGVEAEYLRRNSLSGESSTTAALLVHNLFGLPWFVQSVFDLDSFALFGIVGLCVWLFLLFVALGISESQRRFHFLGNSKFELTVVVLLCLDLIFICVVDSWYALRLRRVDPYSLARYYSDSRMLLSILGIQVGAHVCLSIRWCFILVVELSAISLYSAFVFVSGPEGTVNSLGNLVLLTGIITLLSVGKRANEKADRDAMLDFLDEKTRRFSAEYQLEVLSGQSRKPAQKTLDLESQASTTRTGLAFQGGLSSIEEVIKIGKAEQWFIGVPELRIFFHNRLGEGGFGVVYEGTYFGTAVAVKTSLIQDDIEKVTLQQLNEIRILRHLRHPNIVQFFGASWSSDERHLYIVLELVRGVSLENFVPCLPCAQTICPEILLLGRETRTRLLEDIAFALQFLHSRRPSAVVHGDIKSQNIFVERHDNWGGPPAYRAKLLDFGLARVLTRNAERLGGTLRWVAPEVYKRSSEFGTPADVFSFGRICFFVITGKRPLEESTVEETKQMLRDGQFPELSWPAEEPLTQQLRPWIECCTLVAQASRPTIVEVVEALFINNTPLIVSDMVPLFPVDSSEYDWQHRLEALQAFYRKDASTGASEDTSTTGKFVPPPKRTVISL